MYPLNNVLFTITGQTEGWELFINSLVPMLTGTIKATIPLAIISFIIGLIIALLTAMMRISKSPFLTIPATFYVSAIRGTPLLVQLFIIFYGMPTLDITFDPYPAAIIAFSLNVGAYASEIIQGFDIIDSKRAMGSGCDYWDDKNYGVKKNYTSTSNTSISSAFI